jgi:2-phosphosulfolactate phosphatase
LYFDQTEYDTRFEWGMAGVDALVPISDVIIIVDVLSFSTSVDIVVGRGGGVLPYDGPAEALTTFAQAKGALVASKTRHSTNAYSLAPSSLVSFPAGARIVLPSLNGSVLSLATQGLPTLAGCLRNARATAACANRLGKRISVIAAGERWQDGTLRAALEDLIGAGAVLAHLDRSRSPEAELAVAAYDHFSRRLFDTLLACGSGKELAGLGFTEDVRLASELNASRTAARLMDGEYRAAFGTVPENA